MSFEAARRKLEDLVAREPRTPGSRAPSIALAGLGRPEEALAAARKGVADDAPEARVVAVLFQLQDLALVEVMLGQEDSAIDRLDDVASKSGRFLGFAGRT